MDKLLLGIDVGTSACKTALFDLEGNAVSQTLKPYPVYHPAPGHVEQDAQEWWNGVCHAIRELFERDGIDPLRVAGVGVDGQSWSAIPVDRNGRVLYNTPIWMDTRASEISLKVLKRLGEQKLFSISGNSFEPTYSTPKILWFKEKLPEIYKKTWKFLQSNSYIVFKLTGSFTQDKSQGYGNHAFDIKKGCWDDGFCDELGIDREKLPEKFQCHSVAGETTKEAAEITGLRAGIPVVCGGLDASCGTLGAGVIEPGKTQEQGGQAGGMSICIREPIVHPRLVLGLHVVPSLWLLQGGTVGGGGALKWFRDELGAFESEMENRTGRNAFCIMDEEAGKVNPGSGGLIFLPYMAGERSPIWDKNAKAVLMGLGYDKSKSNIIRAIMEGCAYALQHNIKTAEEAGVAIDRLEAVGGAANSFLWTQIKADVTGKIFDVPSSDTATVLGAAILAGVGTGIYRDFHEAVLRTVHIKRTHEPDMAKHEVYKKYYDIYLEIYEKLKNTMQKISCLDVEVSSI